MDVPSPDEKSVITYVSSIYDAFPKVPEGGEGISATVKEPLKYLLTLICLGRMYWVIHISHCIQSIFIQSKLNLHYIHTRSLSLVPGSESVTNFVASSLDYSRCQEIESHLASPWGALKLGLWVLHWTGNGFYVVWGGLSYFLTCLFFILLIRMKMCDIYLPFDIRK